MDRELKPLSRYLEANNNGASAFILKSENLDYIGFDLYTLLCRDYAVNSESVSPYIAIKSTGSHLNLCLKLSWLILTAWPWANYLILHSSVSSSAKKEW